MDIRFKKLSPEAKTPYKKIDIDAGFDLYATWKKETDKYIEYGTDIAFEIPVGFVGLMFPRSSVTNHDLILKNCVGVIDASYRGEIKCRFAKYHHDLFSEFNVPEDWINSNKIVNKKPEYYEVGDRVCQIMFVEIPFVWMVEVDELSDTERGTAGYGHSGK